MTLTRKQDTRPAILRAVCIVLPVILFACGGDGSDSTGDPAPVRSPAAKGESCMGLLGLACAEGLYCNVADFSCGAADQTGTCEEVPEVCIEIYAPVCGCDDKTYANSCKAAAAGISISAEGECATSSPK